MDESEGEKEVRGFHLSINDSLVRHCAFDDKT